MDCTALIPLWPVGINSTVCLQTNQTVLEIHGIFKQHCFKCGLFDRNDENTAYAFCIAARKKKHAACRPLMLSGSPDEKLSFRDEPPSAEKRMGKAGG